MRTRAKRVEALVRGTYGQVVTWVAQTTSTMDLAAGDEVRHGAVFVADAQSDGRGSRGRTWSSPEGRDLYFTIALRTELEPSLRPPLTLAVGVGIAECVEAVTGVSARVKWPNDVRLGGLKCAGVLLESRRDVLLIGVGLNVNRREGLDGLGATSLANIAGREFDRCELLASVLESIEVRIDEQLERGSDATVARLRPRLEWLGERVTCGDHTGWLRGVDAAGAVLLEGDGGGVRRCVVGPLRQA